MSELSDLLGGLLGNEAGKDSGGMDGLFDLLGGLMQSAPAQKESPQQETSGAKGPDAADFEQILHIVSKLQDDDKNIRLLRALQPHLTPERAARTEDVIKIMRLANLLPLLRFSSGPEEKTADKEEPMTMDHWNKGGLSREEFLRMRENALRQLQELARKQQALASAAGNSPQASDTISKKENMPLEQVPVQPVMQPEQIRPAEDKNTIAEPWKETGPKAAQMPDPAVSDVLEQPRDGDSIREREESVKQPDFGRSSQELPERKQPWQIPPFPAGERGRN